MAIKSLSIRIDETMLHKLHVVADYEGRSANNEILIFTMRRAQQCRIPHAVCRQTNITRASR